MQRADHVRAIEFVVHAKRNLKEIKRGKIDMDAANFSAAGYAFADNAFLGTVLGLKLQRSEALADDHLDYVDELESTTYATTLVNAAVGAFTAVDQTYTEAGACAAATALNIVKITGSTLGSNNGSFLCTSKTANTIVVSALPGESVDVVDEAAVATSVII